MKIMLNYKLACMCILAALLCCGAGSAYSAITSHEFSRYQVILDKKPFGEVTPSEAGQQQAALNDVVAKELEMKSIVDEGTSIRVGWLDKKTNKNFSLAIGETYEGVQLVSVNYDNEEAVVKKGGETAVVRLHPDKDKDKAAASAVVPPPALAAMSPPPGAFPFPADQPATAPRRPFFTDLKTRRGSPFQPLGTNVLPFQAKPLDSFFKVSTGAFPRAQSPFGPFQVPAGGAKGANPFQALSSGGTNTVNPFAPVTPAVQQVVPQNPNPGNQSQGQTVDPLQGQSSGQTQIQPDVNQLPVETEVTVEEVAQ